MQPDNHVNNNPPPARGVRMEWSAVPVYVRAAAEKWLTSPVVEAISQPSGFSPGVAARLLLADGRRFFVKAVNPEPNPISPVFHRREALISRALPDGLPVPRLLWTFDERDRGEGWIMLIFEDVDGRHPSQPWKMAELQRVLEALETLSARLTPSPLTKAVAGRAGEELADLCSWNLFLGEDAALVDQLDPWVARHLKKLVKLDQLAVSAVEGDTLLHSDVRADNILLTPDQVWLFDWPHACVGANWVDLALFAPSLRMQGGPAPEEFMKMSPILQKADPAGVTAAVAMLAGFFTHRSFQPPPPGLPTLRPFQAAQGAIAREWLAQRTGWG